MPSSSRAAAAFVRQIDKLPLPVKSAPGFLVNRMLAPYLMAAMRAVDEGIAPETVDEAALAFGMPMGPIELADTVGLDICVAVGKLLGDGAAPPRESDEARRRGRARQEDARGLLRWEAGKAVKAGAGRRCRPGSPTASSAPMSPRRSAALADGIVADADLVDAGAIFGTGFAPFRGGPLHYARAALPARCATAAGTGFRCSIARESAAEPRPGRASPGALGPTQSGARRGNRRRGRRTWKESGSKHYPPGVPAEIDVGEYASLRDVFDESVAQFGVAARVHLHGQVDHLRRARHAVRGVRRLAAGRSAAARARASR